MTAEEQRLDDASRRHAVWMRRALEVADRAWQEDEVPVGALVIAGDQVIAEGWNRSILTRDPSAHAEILAMRRAAAVRRNHRLTGCTLVCTLEPCVMCFGALLEARISTLVIGAADSKRGALRLWRSGRLTSFPSAPLQILESVEQAACSDKLVQYFRSRRAASSGQDR
jgi:tRNA(adenine34) deaminase